MKRKFTVIVLALLLLSAYKTLVESLRADATLVAPGVGAERILLGNPIHEELVQYSGYKSRTTHKKRTESIFKDILKIDTSVQIPFTSIYYFPETGASIFTSLGKVSAIGGTATHRITTDGLDLSKGADYILFHYGNSGLETIVDGDHRIYIYPGRGLAFADDKGDDSIDMYVIFTPYKVPVKTKRSKK